MNQRCKGVNLTKVWLGLLNNLAVTLWEMGSEHWNDLFFKKKRYGCCVEDKL